MVLLTLDIGTAIITFAGLSFLGLGVPPPTPEWGSMVASGSLLIDQWWVSGSRGWPSSRWWWPSTSLVMASATGLIHARDEWQTRIESEVPKSKREEAKQRDNATP